MAQVDLIPVAKVCGNISGGRNSSINNYDPRLQAKLDHFYNVPVYSRAVALPVNQKRRPIDIDQVKRLRWRVSVVTLIRSATFRDRLGQDELKTIRHPLESLPGVVSSHF